MSQIASKLHQLNWFFCFPVLLGHFGSISEYSMLPIKQVTLFKKIRSISNQEKFTVIFQWFDSCWLWCLLNRWVCQFPYLPMLSHTHSSVSAIMQQTSTRAKSFFNRMKISIVEFNNSRTLIFVNNVCWKSQRIKQFLELWSLELDAQWIMEWTRMFPRTTLKPRYSPIIQMFYIVPKTKMCVSPFSSEVHLKFGILAFDISIFCSCITATVQWPNIL